MHGATWDTFIKNIFSRKYKKKNLKIHGAAWDTSIKKISSQLSKYFLTIIKKFPHNYKKISSQL